MLLLRDSRPADSMSMSISFWPSTIATRSSSACVALNSIRFMQMTPLRARGVAARVGQRTDANGSGRKAALRPGPGARGPSRRARARRRRAGPVRVDDSVRRHGVHGPHWALPATSGRRLAFFPENSASIRVPWPRRAREPRLKCSSCRAGDRFRSAFGGTGPVQSVLVIRDSGGRCAELLVRRASPEHPWTRAGRLARRPFRSGRDRTQRPKYSNVSSLRTKPEAVSTNGPPVRVAAWAVRHVPVDDDDAGQRLDNFLVRLCRDVPKSHLYRLIRSGQLRVNGKRQAADYRLQAGDSIRVPPIRLEPAAEATGVGAASGAATERIRRTRAGL